MRVLMFGWEFPPHNSGGLGVACCGLVRGLASLGARVLFVLPQKLNHQNKEQSFRLIFSDEFGDRALAKSVASALTPYLTSSSYNALALGQIGFYGPNLISEVFRYGQAAAKIALQEHFDVIHAHDWLSMPAGLLASQVSGKPLVVHIHATEFDRTGGQNVNPQVYAIEKEGLEKAQAVIAVSNFTKNKIVSYYGINPAKVKVAHNAVEIEEFRYSRPLENLLALKKKGVQFVLFVGRLTLQKGVDYFLRAAKNVLAREPQVRFLVAGSGDMERQLIDLAAELGIADKVFFLGFVDRTNDLAALYKTADLYVMPSVSEPFGITPLEALASGAAVLISKQSGVAETLTHCLRVDFWDINEMTNQILAVLRHRSLRQALQENGHQEVKKFSWQDTARKCLAVYDELLA